MQRNISLNFRTIHTKYQKIFFFYNDAGGQEDCRNNGEGIIIENETDWSILEGLLLPDSVVEWSLFSI